MSALRVLICDDDTSQCDEIEDTIRRSGFTGIAITKLVGPDLTQQLGALFKRVNSAVKDPSNYVPGEDLSFDSADIVLFDNNLAHLEITGARLTAESIVGYVRCFTKAAYIVSLNKNPDVDFDLRYLVGDYETRADIALNSAHLAITALWNGAIEESQEPSFLPWYWPVLHAAPSKRIKQIEFLADKISQPVLGTFNFPDDDESLGYLSLHARGVLSSKIVEENAQGDHVSGVTFAEVFEHRNRALPSREERKGLMGALQTNPEIRRVITRAVAADIALWFARDVVGPQEMLVDLPHLVARMPSLLGSKANSIAGWNELRSVDATQEVIEDSLYQHLSRYEFKHQLWLKSPSFWWPKLKADSILGELIFKPAVPTPLSVVFCEDVSLFIELEGSIDNNDPKEFKAEFESAWNYRFVRLVEGYQYAPKTRLAL